MKTGKKLLITYCLLGLCVLPVPVLAAPTGFAPRAPYASGAAVIEPAFGGEYVHARPQADARRRSPALLAGAPARQTWVFFSAEEEQALLRYRDQQLAVRLHAAAARVPRVRVARVDWPKVVVRGGTVCVPELASSDAPDWRAHLVCHRAEAPR
jgi:hypothetical protein